jgi:drug/metabolite transporter (DMT)-like permease
LWLNQSLTTTQIIGGLLVLGAVCVLQLRATDRVGASGAGAGRTAELEPM